MRTAKLTVNGKEYLLCFSVRVLRAVSERYGDVTHIPEALDQEDTVRAMDEAFWILSAMMEAGAAMPPMREWRTLRRLPWTSSTICAISPTLWG